MRYPKFLSEKGRIGFIAPSFGCTTEPYVSLFESSKKRLSGMGFKTVEGPNCHMNEGIGKSNTPKACGDEINDFFINDRCDAIISCGGGETMVEDLVHVDFEGIAKAEPRWFMGYSDNTNLTLTLPTLADTAAIYGPCISDFGMEKLHPAVQDALNLMMGRKLTMKNYDRWQLESLKSEEQPYLPYNATEPFAMRAWLPDERFARDERCASAEESARDENRTRDEKNALGEETDGLSFGRYADGACDVSFSGRLLGGCLDCLMILAGTRFDRVREFCERYRDDGIIWFIESCDLSSISVRRALWQLDNAGWFDTAKGFLIGRPGIYGDESFGLDRFDAVVGQLGHHRVPILMDLDIGHMPPRMPIISGAMADVRSDGRSIVIDHRLL